MDITKDAKKLLLLMYKEYQRRRKKGMTRSDAMFFCGADTIKEDLLPDELLQDVNDYIRELHRAGYVTANYADNTVWLCELTTEAIMKIENLPADTLRSIADFIGNFVP